MAQTLAVLSRTISQLVAGATPLLSAIRVGPNRHVTGLLCEGNVIVTTDQDLPALDGYTVVFPNGHLAAARPGLRDIACNLAVLGLETPRSVVSPEVTATSVGSLSVIVGADADGSATVRLAVVHRFLRTAEGPMPVLDLPGHSLEPGSLVLDANGRLIGLAAFGPNREAAAIPGSAISRILMPPLSLAGSQSLPPAPLSPTRRGWLGLALQPITVPDALAARAGQASGRMVVSITKGGPAEIAGLRVGDVVLALNGTSASGPHTLRAFLGSERVGATVDVRLLREGKVLTTHLTIGFQPD